MKTKFLLAISVGLFFSGTLLSCGKSGSNPVASDEPEQSVSNGIRTDILFRGVVAGNEYGCEKVFNLGRNGTPFKIHDFRLFISEIELITSDNETVKVQMQPSAPWQNTDVALISFGSKTEPPDSRCVSEKSINNKVTLDIPDRDYKELRFTVGVPQTLNHLDSQNGAEARPPLNVQQMYWNWKGGYRFMKVDGKSVDEKSSLSFHLGSSGCGEGDIAAPPSVPCTISNRPRIVLKDFRPSRDLVSLDLSALLGELDLTQSGICMGYTGEVCQKILPQLGLASPSAQIKEQAVFRLQKRN